MRQLGRGRRLKPILTRGSVAPGTLFETLFDDFADGSIDTAKWPGNYGTTSETGGRARVTVDTGFSGFQSFPNYTIAGSYVLLRVDTWPAPSTATTATVELIIGSDQVASGTRLVLAADVVTGQLTASSQVSFVDGGSVSTGFSTAAPLWLRIDGRSGSLSFDYSLTGNPSSWVNIRSGVAFPDWLTTAGQKVIVQGHRDAGTNDFFEFDDFNLPTSDPPTPSPIVKQGPQFRFPGRTVYAPKGFHRGEESPQPRVYMPFSGRKPFPLPPGGVFRKGLDPRPAPSNTIAVSLDGSNRPIPLAIRLTSEQGDVILINDVRSFNFRSVVPGGFATLTMTIDRKIAERQPEIQQFGRAYLYDTRSGDTVWEGRVEDPGKGVDSNGETWTVTAIGPSAHASDDTFNYLPIDRTVDHFEKFGGSTKSGSVGTYTDDSDRDGVKVQFGGGISVASPQYVAGRSQRVYNASTTLGSVRATVVGGGTGQWDMVMYVYSPGGGTDLIDSVALTTTPQSFYGEVGSDFSSTGTTTHLRMNRTGASTTPDDNAFTFFYDIVIRTVMRDEEGTLLTDYSDDYVTASQIVQDLIGSHTSQYDGLDAYIEVTTNHIEQFAYDATTVRDALNDILALEGAYYWAAWETVARSGLWRFEFRPWPTTVRYEATVDDSMNQPGSAAELYNKVNVHWYDAVKRVHVETRTSTVTALDDIGLTRAADLELGSELGCLTSAQAAGDNFLAEHNLPIRNGRLTIGRPILDFDRGMMVDPWMIRPGGLIRLRGVNPERNALNPDGRDGSTIFRITAVNYRSSDNSAELELDTDALSTSQAIAKLARRRPRK